MALLGNMAFVITASMGKWLLSSVMSLQKFAWYERHNKMAADDGDIWGDPDGIDAPVASVGAGLKMLVTLDSWTSEYGHLPELSGESWAYHTDSRTVRDWIPHHSTQLWQTRLRKCMYHLPWLSLIIPHLKLLSRIRWDQSHPHDPGASRGSTSAVSTNHDN